jgi:hypothetical protein
MDPLLPKLVADSWSKLPPAMSKVFDEMPANGVYPAYEDFAYFSVRLLNLQEFVLSQSPTDLKTLWRDRHGSGHCGQSSSLAPSASSLVLLIHRCTPAIDSPV